MTGRKDRNRKERGKNTRQRDVARREKQRGIRPKIRNRLKRPE